MTFALFKIFTIINTDIIRNETETQIEDTALFKVESEASLDENEQQHTSGTKREDNVISLRFKNLEKQKTLFKVITL